MKDNFARLCRSEFRLGGKSHKNAIVVLPLGTGIGVRNGRGEFLNVRRLAQVDGILRLSFPDEDFADRVLRQLAPPLSQRLEIGPGCNTADNRVSNVLQCLDVGTLDAYKPEQDSQEQRKDAAKEPSEEDDNNDSAHRHYKQGSNAPLIYHDLYPCEAQSSQPWCTLPFH